jgi:hypothetical protein
MARRIVIAGTITREVVLRPLYAAEERRMAWKRSGKIIGNFQIDDRSDKDAPAGQDV